MLVGTRLSPPRRPAATETALAGDLIFCRRGPTSSTYLKGPRTRSRLQATSASPRRASQAVDRPVVAIFPNSGRFGRRRAPVQYATARTSPAHPTPPVASPCPCGAAQLPNLDRRPLEPKNHFTTVAPSAAELAAGDSFHLRRPSDHQGDRLGLASPSLPSDALEEPPFVAGDRLSPAPVGQRRGGRGKNGQT